MEIRDIAYEKYRFNWMLSRGFNIETLLESLDNFITEGNYNDNFSLNNVFSDWEYECGFNGECYVSYEEFLHNEWEDKNYMFELLNNEEYQMYLDERGL